MIDALELSKPTQLLFKNRAEISRAYMKVMPEEWALDDVWVPSGDLNFPPSKLISKSDAFTPDFFLLSYEMISKELRNTLTKFNKFLKYYEVDGTGSCQEFMKKDYKLTIFPSLSPFEEIFYDFVRGLDARGEPFSKPKIRSDFRLDVPIFNVATGPWLMCTEEVVAEIMPHPITGLAFINYETDEVLVAGS
ncbi:MAG: hypothetical protein ABIS51_00955 [Sphingomonas sp.]